MLQQRIRRSRSPPRPPEATPTLALNPLILCYLILALLAASTSAQNTSVTLPLRPTTYPLSQLASTPLVLSLAPLSTPETVYLSLSLCTDSSPPLVVLTTSEEIDVPTSATDLSAKGGSVPKSAVWRVDWDQGFASWNGTVGAGGMRVALESAEDGTGGEVEISMAGTAPIQTVATTVPVLGDTTSSHLLLFTPTFLAPPPDQASPQTYPNYQIPPPVFNVTPPSATPNHTLFIFPSSFTDDGLARSSCAVKKRAGRVNGTTVVDREMRLVKGKGWREMLVLDGSTGLDPGGNYTVWIERTDAGGGATQWSGPLWFKMKPVDFPCPLAYSLHPSCPSIAYAAALPSSTSGIITSPTFPSNLSSTIDSYLSSFATTLSTYACGRDTYSPVSSCEDCYDAYREWVCRQVIPRCADPTVDSSLQATGPISTQNLPGSNPSYQYTPLLPCLETCHLVDRVCPVFLGFRCPLSHGGRDGLGTARSTYGVGFVDFVGEVGEGGEDGREFSGNGEEGGQVRGCEIWEGLRG